MGETLWKEINGLPRIDRTVRVVEEYTGGPPIGCLCTVVTCRDDEFCLCLEDKKGVQYKIDGACLLEKVPSREERLDARVGRLKRNYKRQGC